MTVDTSNGAYDDSPNNGGNSRDYYVTGSSRVTNNVITVSMTQGSSPKASVNHKINLTVNLVDKSSVRNALTEYEKLYEGAYSSDSWNTFETAKRTVWEYLNNHAYTDDSAAVQQQYISTLDRAAAELETVDYTQLEAVINTANDLNPDNFTDSSYNRLMKYAGEYTDLLGCASSQSQVDRAVSKLNTLLGELVSAYTVSGYITNFSGAAVEGAQINGSGVTATSAQNGFYKVKLESGEYTLTVSTATSVDRQITVRVSGESVPGADVEIINCDLNGDGRVNGRDLAAAKSQNNAAAKTEIGDTITARGNNVQYEPLIIA